MSSDPARLLRFEPSWFTVFVPSVADAAEALKDAIEARDWERALAASVRLGVIADGVNGMVRTVSEHDRRPLAAFFDAFDALANDSLLGLGLPSERWAQVVSDYAFLHLAIGWSDPRDLVAAALCGRELEWPALQMELDHPGSFPEMRDTESLMFGTNLWRQVEANPWSARLDAADSAVASLSLDARFVVATLGGLRRRFVVELRHVSHAMKLSQERLVAALRELELADLAEFPASFETLAHELTGAELRSIAADAGVKRTGKKAVIVSRLIDAGQVDPLAAAINRLRMYHPIGLGPRSDAFGAQRAIAGLWTSMWESTTNFGGLAPRIPGFIADAHDEFEEILEDRDEGEDEPRLSPVDPRGACWRSSVTEGIAGHLAAFGRLAVFTHGGSVRTFAEDGRELWVFHTGEPKPDYSPALFDTARGLLVVTIGTTALIDPTDGRLLWTWQAPDGAIVQQPAIRDDRLFIVTDDGLYAVEIGGEQLWWFGRRRLGSPAVDGETVVVTRAGQMLNILDANTGELIRRRSMDDVPRTWAPLLSEGVIFLSGYHLGSWSFVALDARSGDYLWSHEVEAMEYEVDDTEDRARPTPPARVVNALLGAPSDGLPYGASTIRQSFINLLELNDSKPMAADEAGIGEAVRRAGYELLGRVGATYMLADGQTLWGVRYDVPALTSQATPSTPSGPLAKRWVAEFNGFPASSSASMSRIGIGDTYIAVAAGLHMAALDRDTGAVRWSTPTVSDFVHCAGPSCFAVYEEEIEALDGADGAVIWHHSLAAGVAQVAHDELHVFVVTEDGGASCLDAASGAVLWRVTGPDEWDFGTRPGWASRRVGDLFQWRTPEGVTRAVLSGSGVEVEPDSDVDLLADGLTRERLNAGSRWWNRWSLHDGAVSLFSGDSNQGGELVIRGGDADEIALALKRGWEYHEAAAAADANSVVLTAIRRPGFVKDLQVTYLVEDLGEHLMRVHTVWLFDAADGPSRATSQLRSKGAVRRKRGIPPPHIGLS